MIGSDEFDTSRAECRIHLFFRGEGDSGFRVQIDPCSHRDRTHSSSHWQILASSSDFGDVLQRDNCSTVAVREE